MIYTEQDRLRRLKEMQQLAITPLNIRQMQKSARIFGGRCLSKKYVNSKTQLRWRCVEGHEWNAKPAHVLTGHWCPICSSGISERICRALVERMTGILFPKAKPSWLKNERGQQMELDGYAPSLGLAFEYQGIQHYEPISFFQSRPEKFKRQQEDDEHRRRLCLQHDVTLLEIPYYRRVHTIDEMQRLAKAKGGACLSTIYKNPKSKLRWRCAKGHEWKAGADPVMRGHWCLKCSFDKLRILFALKIEDMQKTAIKCGGECLSKIYVNSQQKLLWRCAKGHEWEAIGNSVRRGTWCPVCAGKRPA